MFNTYSYKGGDTNIKVNAVSGTLVKNYKDSFFLRFAIGSHMEEKLFDKEPRLNRKHEKYDYDVDRPVVVIQSMIIGEKLMLAEVMWKEDFDAIFEQEEKNLNIVSIIEEEMARIEKDNFKDVDKYNALAWVLSQLPPKED